MKDFQALPFNRWPDIHRKAFEDATNTKLPLAMALAKNWSPEMRRAVRFAWGLSLDYRRRHGLDIDCRPEQTIDEQPLEGFIRELAARVRYATSANYLRHMGEGLRVMSPGAAEALKLVRRAARDLLRAWSPVPDELTRRVGASDLYEKARDRMDELLAVDVTTEVALSFLDVLKVAIDVLTSLRLGTLSITTKKHVNTIGDHKRLEYFPHEVKTREKLLRSLPAEMTYYVEQGFKMAAFLADEKVLPETHRLWLTGDGRPMSKGWMSQRMRETSRELVGVPLNPQRIRRLGATSVFQFRPRKIEVISKSMHAGPRETFDHYVKTGGGGAALEFFRLTQKKFHQGPGIDEE